MQPGRKPSLLTSELGASHRNLPDVTAAGGTLVSLETPAGMSPIAVQVFELTAPSLLKHQVIREEDVFLLVEFCEQMSLAIEARKRMERWVAINDEAQENGRLDEESQRDYIERLYQCSQMVKHERAAYTQLMKLALTVAGQFGLSPVDRVRLGLYKAHGQSLLEALGGVDE